MEEGTCKRMQSSQSLDRTGPESSPYFAPAATGNYRSAQSESYQFTTCLTNMSYFFNVPLPPSASPEGPPKTRAHPEPQKGVCRDALMTEELTPDYGGPPS